MRLHPAPHENNVNYVDYAWRIRCLNDSGFYGPFGWIPQSQRAYVLLARLFPVKMNFRVTAVRV